MRSRRASRGPVALLRGATVLAIVLHTSGCRPGDAAANPNTPAHDGSDSASRDAAGARAPADRDPAARPTACAQTLLAIGVAVTELSELELAMQNAIAVVAYDCTTIDVLDCSGPGAYGFSAYGSVRRRTAQHEDHDAGERFEVAIASVGRHEAPVAITRAQLFGSECDRATHYVRAAELGAFVTRSSEQRDATTTGKAFGAQAGARTSRSRVSQTSAGDLDACAPVPAGTAPAPDCRAPVEIDLAAL